MTELLLTGVDEVIVDALKKRAQKNRRTIEQEHLLILQEALGGTDRITLAEALLKIPEISDPSVFDRKQ